MAHLEILKELQETTLIREKLLSKLRSELIKLVKGSGDEDVIKDLVEDLRLNRRKYINLSFKICDNRGSLPNELNEDLYTLLEYNVLIALRNELELLSKIYKYIQGGKIRLLMLEDISSDIESVNEIIDRFAAALPTLRDVPPPNQV